MILLFDIGNTRIKWALANAGQIEQSGVLASATIAIAKLNDGLRSVAPPDAVWISCVGPNSTLEALLAWLQARFSQAATVVKVSQACCGIENGYHDIESLGVDRWVAVIGARAVVPQGDLIVIDAGTAITIDWLSADNVFQGGAILPGAVIMHDALIGNTAKIQSEYRHVVDIIGRTTQECVNSGVSFGLAGAVERIVGEMLHGTGRPVRIVVTGGGADAITCKTNLEYLHLPHLVISGLLEIASQGNQPNA